MEYIGLFMAIGRVNEIEWKQQPSGMEVVMEEMFDDYSCVIRFGDNISTLCIDLRQ